MHKYTLYDRNQSGNHNTLDLASWSDNLKPEVESPEELKGEAHGSGGRGGVR